MLTFCLWVWVYWVEYVLRLSYENKAKKACNIFDAFSKLGGVSRRGKIFFCCDFLSFTLAPLSSIWRVVHPCACLRRGRSIHACAAIQVRWTTMYDVRNRIAVAIFSCSLSHPCGGAGRACVRAHRTKRNNMQSFLLPPRQGRQAGRQNRRITQVRKHHLHLAIAQNITTARTVTEVVWIGSNDVLILIDYCEQLCGVMIGFIDHSFFKTAICNDPMTKRTMYCIIQSKMGCLYISLQ